MGGSVEAPAVGDGGAYAIAPGDVVRGNFRAYRRPKPFCVAAGGGNTSGLAAEMADLSRE